MFFFRSFFFVFLSLCFSHIKCFSLCNLIVGIKSDWRSVTLMETNNNWLNIVQGICVQTLWTASSSAGTLLSGELMRTTTLELEWSYPNLGFIFAKWIFIYTYIILDLPKSMLLGDWCEKSMNKIRIKIIT